MIPTSLFFFQIIFTDYSKNFLWCKNFRHFFPNITFSCFICIKYRFSKVSNLIHVSTGVLQNFTVFLNFAVFLNRIIFERAIEYCELTSTECSVVVVVSLAGIVSYCGTNQLDIGETGDSVSDFFVERRLRVVSIQEPQILNLFSLTKQVPVRLKKLECRIVKVMKIIAEEQHCKDK